SFRHRKTKPCSSAGRRPFAAPLVLGLSGRNGRRSILARRGERIGQRLLKRQAFFQLTDFRRLEARSRGADQLRQRVGEPAHIAEDLGSSLDYGVSIPAECAQAFLGLRKEFCEFFLEPLTLFLRFGLSPCKRLLR